MLEQSWSHVHVGEWSDLSHCDSITPTHKRRYKRYRRACAGIHEAAHLPSSTVWDSAPLISSALGQRQRGAYLEHILGGWRPLQSLWWTLSCQSWHSHSPTDMQLGALCFFVESLDFLAPGSSVLAVLGSVQPTATGVHSAGSCVPETT